MKIRQGDTVQIIAGKDRGKKGTVEAVLPARDRVVVGGANLLKKAVKARPGVTQTGIVEFSAPIHVSNVSLLDPKDSKPARSAYQFTGTGQNHRKIRVSKRTGTEIPVNRS